LRGHRPAVRPVRWIRSVPGPVRHVVPVRVSGCVPVLVRAAELLVRPHYGMAARTAARARTAAAARPAPVRVGVAVRSVRQRGPVRGPVRVPVRSAAAGSASDTAAQVVAPMTDSGVAARPGGPPAEAVPGGTP